jgi:hypothetical protein
MNLEEGPDRKTIQSVYLHGDGPALDGVRKATAQAGVGALRMFERIFRERFGLLSIDTDLEALRNVL